MAKHPDYWKIKASVLAAQMARLQADLQLRGILAAAGLDPDATYAMNDAEETLTKTEPSSQVLQ